MSPSLLLLALGVGAWVVPAAAIAGLLVLSAVISASEVAFFSLSPSDLKALEHESTEGLCARPCVAEIA